MMLYILAREHRMASFAAQWLGIPHQQWVFATVDNLRGVDRPHLLIFGPLDTKDKIYAVARACGAHIMRMDDLLSLSSRYGG